MIFVLYRKQRLQLKKSDKPKLPYVSTSDDWLKIQIEKEKEMCLKEEQKEKRKILQEEKKRKNWMPRSKKFRIE